MATRELFSIGILALLFAGCGEEPVGPGLCDPLAAGPSLDTGIQAGLPSPEPGDVDAEWAQLARDVPGGWGGVFLEAGQLIVYFVDMTRAPAALAILHSYDVGSPYDIRDAEVRRGRWDFAQLYDWLRYARVEVGFPAGLLSYDVDESRNRLVVQVTDRDAVSRIETALDALEMPCELMLVEIG